MNRKTLLSFTLSALLAGAACGAQAEDGTITFTGVIEDGTCAIATDSQTIDVDFGTIGQNAASEPNNNSINKTFEINLTDCPASLSAANVSWSGQTSSSIANALKAYSDEYEVLGIGWIIAEGDQGASSTELVNMVDLTGTPGAAQPLTVGNNTLYYTAGILIKSPPAIPGNLTGEASYSVTYN